MNCREFRRKHDAYIDDTLSGVEIDGMASHRRLCDHCSQLDTRVRRGLMLARNLPTIEPSSDFATRLQARLTEERKSLHQARQMRETEEVLHVRPLSTSTYILIAAGVFVAAGLAGVATQIRTSEDAMQQFPAVASVPVPELERSALSVSAIVAPTQAGTPLWPTVMVAEQSPWRFASDTTGP